jgi:hypothetical protein
MLSAPQKEMVTALAGKALHRKFFTPPGALRALEKAGYWGHEGALHAIHQLLPVLQKVVFYGKDGRLGRKAMELVEEVFFPREPLSFKIKPPEVSKRIHHVSWKDILRKIRAEGKRPRFASRSLISEISKDQVLVTKLMRPEDSREALVNEVRWMLYLKGFSFEKRFVVPEPVGLEGDYIFRLCGLPVKEPDGLRLHPERLAIAFTVHKDYFVYPNSPEPSKHLSHEEIQEVMTRSAYILGKLASRGIIHTDIIALFHSRVQAKRRLDCGRYCWWQGYVGRLDRWLHSCDWPNFGLSGIRDFEHFIPFKGSLQEMFHHMGNHLLGLFLVAGSYFRNKERSKAGLDKRGRPVDTWYLFDKALFREIIEGVVASYYEGLTGKAWLQDAFAFDFDSLIRRMVEEMGIDNHMVEKFRVQHQREVTFSEFKEILLKGGYSDHEIHGLTRGKEDIDVMTGPHLGEFNGEISLPEMIDLIRKAAMLFALHGFTDSDSRFPVPLVPDHDPLGPPFPFDQAPKREEAYPESG